MSNVDIIYFDAGSGHKATAIALKEQLEQNKWNVSLVNLRDVLDSVDPVKKWLGFEVEGFYNGYLGTGWTVGSGPMLRILQAAIRLFSDRIENAAYYFWAGRDKKNLIVSTIPNFNKQLYDGIKMAFWTKEIPYVTVMCDLADSPPHFWMEEQDQYIICGSDRAWHQAVNMGYSQDKIKCTTGMVVNPKFYSEGLKSTNPNIIRGLVSYGGTGSNKILKIARMISKSKIKNELHINFVCGHNRELEHRLTRENFDYSYQVFGFVNNLPDLMDRSDFFIGKPGPGSISEAIVKHLPVLVEDSWSTMIQERYNIEWILDNGFGDKTKIGDIEKFEHFIDNLPRYKFNTMLYYNDAVFRIPKLLEGILKQEKRV